MNTVQTLIDLHKGSISQTFMYFRPLHLSQLTQYPQNMYIIIFLYTVYVCA